MGGRTKRALKAKLRDFRAEIVNRNNEAAQGATMNDAGGMTEPGLEKPLEYLRSVLIPTETLEAWAIQRRDLRAVASAGADCRNERTTDPHYPQIIGGFDVSDIRWQDLEEVTLRVGVLGADLMIRAGRATDLASQGTQGSQRLEFEGLA